MKYTFKCFGHKKVIKENTNAYDPLSAIPYAAANDWAQALSEMQFDEGLYPKPQPYDGSWYKVGDNEYQWGGNQYWD